MTTNTKLSVQATEDSAGENHHVSGLSLEFDYTDRKGNTSPMIGIVSQDSNMSPLEAMGANFAKAMYEKGWSDGYSHAKGDAAGNVDYFLRMFFAGDPRAQEIRMKAFAAAMDVNDEEVIWVNNHPALKSERLAFPIRSTCQERNNCSTTGEGIKVFLLPAMQA